MRLSGTFPVLCTPFQADGSVDTAEFDTLVGFALDCGADGCVFPGMASEVSDLTDAERETLVARLGKLLAGKVPFIVGASAPTPAAARHHLDAGARAGAAAAMVMAPAHLGRDIAAQTAFFAELAEGAPIPVMLQNAPSPAGAGLPPEAVADIARAVPGIVYVKEETQPCGQNLSRILAAAGDAIAGVFGGAGGRYITDELARGSLGTMPAAELTDLHVRLVNAWRQGDEAEARRLFRAALPALNLQAIFRMEMTKATLARRGVLTATAVRARGPVMDAMDHAELGALLDQLAPDLLQYPLRTKEAAE